MVPIWVGWLLSEKFKKNRLYVQKQNDNTHLIHTDFIKKNDNTHVVVIVAHIFLWFYVQKRLKRLL